MDDNKARLPGNSGTRQVTGKERASYAAYFVGQNIFYIFLSSYLNTYFLDIGMTALVLSALILVVKIWDAVNDPLFGAIVDRVRFKKGKFLPWLRVSLVAIPLTTVLLFAIPSNIHGGVLIAWGVIGYILWDTAYTICDVPIFGIITTITSNLSERTSLMAIGRIAAMVAAIVVTVAVPQLRSAIGGWFPMALMLSLLGLLFMIPICVTAKERIKPVTSDKEVTFKEMGSFVAKNKYMLIFYAAFIVSQTANIVMPLGLIMARAFFNDEGVSSIMSIVMLLPTIILGGFIPRILKKIDKYNLFIGALIGTAVLNVLAFFVGYENFTLYLIMLALKGIPLGVTIMLMFMFTPDLAEYGTYKLGYSATGIAFSVQTFSVKLTSALASSLSAFALFLIGYVSKEGAVQPTDFPEKLWLVACLIPAVGYAFSALIFSRYKLRDKDVQIMTKANSGEITREEASALLGGKYE